MKILLYELISMVRMEFRVIQPGVFGDISYPAEVSGFSGAGSEG